MELKQGIKIDESYYKVKETRWLTDEVFVLRLPAGRFKFRAGQHLSLGIPGDFQSREYSIYSGEHDDSLEVLVKEVRNGHFSPKLGKLKVGDLVEVHGPFGKFRMDDKQQGGHVLIASGTGIAPFHSMVRTWPALNYQLIHGVRYGNEAYGRDEYDPARYVLCTSGDQTGQVHGRLTVYLKEAVFERETQFYLCGNSKMIFDALEILKEKGFGRDQIHCEVYF